MNDVPLFDDLTPPAERIPITVPTREELCAELADLSAKAQYWFERAETVDEFDFLARVSLVCEQTRAFLGAREP